MRRIVTVWTIVFFFWAVYRSLFVTYEWIDELLIKPLIFVGPILYITLWKEKKSLSTLGFSTQPRNLFFDAYIGIILGILFAFEGLWANYFKYGDFSFTPIPAVAVAAGMGPFIITNLATSISEEILGRGFLFQRFLHEGLSQHMAAIVSSFLFLLLHVPILVTRLHLEGVPMIVYLGSVFFLGFTNCYLLSLRKSIILPILVHLFWNMTIALYL